ncbi:hypothetical protein Aspvir_001882 [Aspergillus viridinutans]|uniref:Uncharacterized protein n=1 Tax=Aspergillus viridinutans TaxID=75553 RepID=A0A9P3F5C6_ASPVI|nr:uncharacterized protein Aspvir_001882 [Aspergillus viridinutans]GIK06237.1 hypothetical protein Aspvir_001882 [Aspergillus viridinutans]
MAGTFQQCEIRHHTNSKCDRLDQPRPRPVGCYCPKHLVSAGATIIYVNRDGPWWRTDPNNNNGGGNDGDKEEEEEEEKEKKERKEEKRKKRRRYTTMGQTKSKTCDQL